MLGVALHLGHCYNPVLPRNIFDTKERPINSLQSETCPNLFASLGQKDVLIRVVIER